jgi:hypothetical protein
VEDIRVTVLLNGNPIGEEIYQKGTRIGHIMDKLLIKYGQIVSFNVYIPPVLTQKTA